MRTRIDKVLLRVLVVVAVADVILFLNFIRPESLTSMSYDPFVSVWRSWLLAATIALAATIGIRWLRRSSRRNAQS